MKSVLNTQPLKDDGRNPILPIAKLIKVRQFCVLLVSFTLCILSCCVLSTFIETAVRLCARVQFVPAY